MHHVDGFVCVCVLPGEDGTRMHGGEAAGGSVKLWVKNRFCSRTMGSVPPT